jgi:non-specific serine/threonine protein kinase
MRSNRVGRTTLLALLLGAVLAGVAACDSGGDPEPSSPARNGSPAGLAWQKLAAAPSERTEVTAAVAGDRIYLVGGFRRDGGTVATVEVYDPSADRWEAGPDLPIAVNHAMAATADGAVHVFGGYLAGNRPSTAAFRFESGSWRRLADLPEGRAAGTAVALGDTVYVAGGIAPGGGLARNMLVYNVAGDRWSTAPGPPTPREHLGGAGFDGLLYTVGGRTREAGNLTAFETFNPSSGRWSTLPDLPTRRGGLAAAATCAGQIVAVGGEAEETFEEAESYDVTTKNWRALPPMPTPRHGLGVVVVGRTLYTLSGGPQPGLHVAGTLEAIDLSSLGTC